MSYKQEIFNIMGLFGRVSVDTLVADTGCSARTARRYRAEWINKQRDGKIHKAVLLPDIHYPHVDWPTWNACMEFMKDYQPDTIIYQGDAMSLDAVSSWNTKKPLLNEGKRLFVDYNGFDADILKPVEAALPDADKVFIWGNHEQRVKWYLQVHPELVGMIEPDKYLKLEERGYEVVPYNGVYSLGKLSVIHGYFWNIYHAAKTVNVFERSVVYAHVHNPQSYCKMNPIDADRYHMATSLPCMCDTRPEYKQNAPNRWVNGFGVVDTLPNRLFNLYSVIVSDGQFAWNGKLYDGR